MPVSLVDIRLDWKGLMVGDATNPTSRVFHSLMVAGKKLFLYTTSLVGSTRTNSSYLVYIQVNQCLRYVTITVLPSSTSSLIYLQNIIKVASNADEKVHRAKS